VRKDYLTSILCDRAEFDESCREDFVFRTLIVTPEHDLTSNEELKDTLTDFISKNPEIFI